MHEWLKRATHLYFDLLCLALVRTALYPKECTEGTLPVDDQEVKVDVRTTKQKLVCLGCVAASTSRGA